MKTVITLHATEQGAEIAAAIAAGLPGPSVVLPFAALHGEWVAEPLGEGRDAAVASQQLKLLTAGYVKAGYHVVVHGEALHKDGAGDDLLRLIRMVPGVRALSVGVGDDAAGVDLALPAGATAESVAAAVAAALTERLTTDA